jgi:hypothetical protein
MSRKFDRNAIPPSFDMLRTFTYAGDQYLYAGNIGVRTYAICSLADRGVYVGRADRTRCLERWRGHLLKLKRGKHHSTLLQQAWDAYSHSNFVFVALPQRAQFDEGAWYAYYQSAGWTMYNAIPL